MADDLPFNAARMVREVVSSRIRPILSGFGFKKERNAFWRETPEHVDVVNFEMSQWGTGVENEVRVSVGVYFPMVERVAWPQYVSVRPPRERHCTVRRRFENDGWMVNDSTDPGDLAGSFCQCVRMDVLPFLDAHHSLESLVSHDPGSHVPVTWRSRIAALHFLGRRDEAASELSKLGEGCLELPESVEFLRRLGMPRE